VRRLARFLVSFAWVGAVLGACGGRVNLTAVGGGAEPSDAGADAPVGPMCIVDPDEPYASCWEVGGSQGCCGEPTPTGGQVNYRYENGHVVSESCGGRGCGWSPALGQYRCGESAAGPMKYSCGESLATYTDCATRPCGTFPATYKTFKCGLNGLRCEIHKQLCFVPGDFPDDTNADPDLVQCVTVPAACKNLDPCSCVVSFLLTPSWCYELGATDVIFGPAR
jgi:hypothetical protein